MIVAVLTTCHTQYTWDSRICIFFYLIEQHSKFLLHTLQVLYMCTLCDSTNINTIIEFVLHKNAFSLLFTAILVNCAPSGETHNYCTPHIIKENSENFLIHRCNYILLSQVYCVWQVVKTPTVILNNPVLHCHLQRQVNNAFHKFPSWPYTQGLLMSVWTLRRHCSFQLCNTATLET